MPTHYEVLGVSERADTETIRQAYVALAKANHPDRRQSDDAAARARAEERIRAANQAWHVLRDPERRAQYDLSLPGPSTARPRPASSAPGASPRPSATSGVVGSPYPASGVVVPAEHASLWKFLPVVVLLVVLGAILVISAYASAGDDATAPTGVRTDQLLIPEIDDCVLVAVLPEGRVPVPVACGTAGARRVVSKVGTPSPCPPSLEQLPLADDETTLCLGVVP